MQIDPASNILTPPENMIGSRSETPTEADFLEMLTTQLRSQDPLSPLEGHEFASQLATFSQLQQLENIHSALESSLDLNLIMTQSINNNMAATLIGKTIRAEVNSVAVGSAGDVSINFEIPEAATDISMDIMDAEGNIVRSLELSSHAAGNVNAVWDGLNADGVRVPEGEYFYRVRAHNAEGGEMAVSSFIEGMVSSVNYTNGQVTLTVNGIDVLLGQVTSVLNDPTRKV